MRNEAFVLYAVRSWVARAAQPCFVLSWLAPFIAFLVMHSPLPINARFRRGSWAKCWACVALLLLLLPVHVAHAVTLHARPASVHSVEHAQSANALAVNARPALRVAPAPRFSRLPVGFEIDRVAHRGGAAWRVERAEPCVLCAPVGQFFHAKRRVPRMNTDDPPRA